MRIYHAPLIRIYLSSVINKCGHLWPSWGLQMPQFSSNTDVGSSLIVPQDPEQGLGNLFHLERFQAAARRQLKVLISFIVVALLLGFTLIMIKTPLYTADAFILIDNKRTPGAANFYNTENIAADAASVLADSQVEVLRSEKISERVALSLHLLEDPEFKDITAPNEGKFLRLRRFIMSFPRAFRGESEATPVVSPRGGADADRLHWVALAVRGDTAAAKGFLDVRRVGRTMVLQISYSSPSAAKSARFANAYAAAFLADQLDAKYEATHLASQWLEGRIAELRNKATSSDLAIQKFREEQGLISSGGRFVSEQQLAEINSQLIAARGDTANAEARYRRIDAIIKGHQTDAIISEAIGNSGIEQLRTKYLEASKRYAEIVSKLGKEHMVAKNLHDEMSQYEKLMFEELTRLAEGYSSEVEIARTREKSLSANLERIVALNAKENKALVTLHELEREGETYRNLHQTYLQRYNEALQQQSFPIIEARIVTSASAPSTPNYPKRLPILLLFGILGAAGGAATGFARELGEKGFQSEEQARSLLGLECLGILPALAFNSRASAWDEGPKAAASAAEAQGEATKISSRPNPEHTPAGSGIFSYATHRPGSSFAETLLAAKLAADVMLAEKDSKIIGVVSALPGEGKTVFSKNFASLLAQLGQKTLLIDADLRLAKLTRDVAPTASQGLVEAVLYKEPLERLFMVGTSFWSRDPSVYSTTPHVAYLRFSCFQWNETAFDGGAEAFRIYRDRSPAAWPLSQFKSTRPTNRCFCFYCRVEENPLEGSSKFIAKKSTNLPEMPWPRPQQGECA